MKSTFLSPLLLSILMSVLIPISIPTASSANQFFETNEEIIRLSDTRHRDFAGNFYDRTLEEKLLPEGSLGRLLERAASLPNNRRIVAIDPMLIEEVEDLQDGFNLRLASDQEDVAIEEIAPSETASAWLSRLNQVTNGDEIAALNYGSPNIAFLSRSAPSELRIHLRLSAQKLAESLSRDVVTLAPLVGASQRLPTFLTEKYTDHRREIRAINRYAKNPETRQFRLINASLIDPNFTRDRAFQFARDLDRSLQRYRNSIRITSGRYTLTSNKERVPVTLINDFSNDLMIQLRVRASNTRVIIGSIDPITIRANSKEQITIPVEVLSSGQSDLIITLIDENGRRVGPETRLPLTLAVISPLTTWLTTGSGVILLLAAIVQSLRRVRRSRRKQTDGERV
ncbi:MAG: DUF6049 family protein [Candidatus Nanopelagicaceae bacterium]